MDDIAGTNRGSVPYASCAWERRCAERLDDVTFHSGLPVYRTKGAPANFLVGTRLEFALKRGLDVAIALVALLALSPLLLFVAVAIRVTTQGPVLFRQQREGLNGKLFWMIKFRSMRPEACDRTGLRQIVFGDPRLTAVGRFLRETSIDELPQLFNVLVGDMSLVGPRPHVPDMVAAGRPYRDLVPYYHLRLAVRPGITGWAQANGWRGNTATVQDSQERVDHDIAYIQNFSLSLDFKILSRTITREFLTGSGH